MSNEFDDFNLDLDLDLDENLSHLQQEEVDLNVATLSQNLDNTIGILEDDMYDNFTSTSNQSIIPEEQNKERNKFEQVLREVFTTVAKDSNSEIDMEDIEWLIDNKFYQPIEVERGNELRHQLLVDNPVTLQKTTSMYKTFYQTQFVAILKEIKNAYKRIMVARSNKLNSIKAEINICKNGIAQLNASLSMRNAPQKQVAQVTNITMKNIDKATAQLNALVRVEKICTLENLMIERFLKNLIECYESSKDKIIDGKLVNASLMYDLELTDATHFKCTCSKCKESSVHDYDKLPKIQLGQHRISLDFANIVDELWEMGVVLANNAKENYYKHLESYLELLPPEHQKLYAEVTEEYNKLFKKYSSLTKEESDTFNKCIAYRKAILESKPILSALSAEDEKKRQMLLNRIVRIDDLAPAKAVLKSLTLSSEDRLNTMPLSVRQSFVNKDGKVPSLPYLLKNKHPLLSKNLEDTVNAVDATNGGLPAHQRYSNDKDYYFNFINQHYKSCFSLEPFEVTAKKNLMLRLNIEDIECPHCGAKMLMYYPAITAIFQYGSSALENQTVKDFSEESVALSALPLLTFLRPCEVKVDTVKSKNNQQKTWYQQYHEQFVHRNDDKTTLIDGTSGGDGITGGLTNEDNAKHSHARIREIMRTYGVDYENYAIRILEALDTNISEIPAILDEYKQNYGRRVITPQTSQSTPQPTVAQPQTQTDIMAELASLDKSAQKEQEQQIQSVSEHIEQTTSEQTEAKVDAIMKEMEEANLEVSDILDVDKLMAEYEGADLDTLSYEELTSKGYYQYETLLEIFGALRSECPDVESIFMKYCDEEEIEKLPLAIKEKCNEFETVIGEKAMASFGFGGGHRW